MNKILLWIIAILLIGAAWSQYANGASFEITIENKTNKTVIVNIRNDIARGEKPLEYKVDANTVRKIPMVYGSYYVCSTYEDVEDWKCSTQVITEDSLYITENGQKHKIYWEISE